MLVAFVLVAFLILPIWGSRQKPDAAVLAQMEKSAAEIPTVGGSSEPMMIFRKVEFRPGMGSIALALFGALMLVAGIFLMFHLVPDEGGLLPERGAQGNQK